MRKSPQFVTRTISGQTLLVPLLPGDQGRWVYELNEVAAFVWGALEDGSTEASLVAKLENEFDITAIDAERDVRALLDDFRSFGALA